MYNQNSCSLCSSKEIVKIFNSINKHGEFVIDKHSVFNVYKCKSCSCIFIKDVLVDKKYYEKYYGKEYYSSNYNFGKKIIYFLQILLCKFYVDRKEKIILRNFQKSDFKNKKLKILDIGCGSGWFLYNLNPIKFNKIGIEINDDGYNQCLKFLIFYS